MGEAKGYYGECLYGHWKSPMKKVIKDNYPKLHKIIIVVQLAQSDKKSIIEDDTVFEVYSIRSPM